MLRRYLVAAHATARVAMSAQMQTCAKSGVVVVARQPGQVVRDIPIHAAPGAITLSADAPGNVARTDYAPHVFVLERVLADDECDAIIDVSEQMGYTEDAPVSLGRNIRRNENCVWIADDAVAASIFERCQSFIPPEIVLEGARGVVRIGPAVGLNRRWRLYKYGEGDTFTWHTDGGWSGSGLGDDGSLVDDLYDGKRHSWMTFLLYLNEDFDGGETSFQNARGEVFSVTPKKGAVLCFFHGYHPLSPLHQSELITRGVKYVARSDVLYEMPENLR
mmetsp:Transcript_17020/g.52352  ORF Transcript_17020/g.52352 Transcript_17020/m.52352 type:complete len:276 (-) Transcript_17020:62-889(-)